MGDARGRLNESNYMHKIWATSGHAKPNIQELKLLTELVESGKVKPVIDRKYDFEQMAGNEGVWK